MEPPKPASPYEVGQIMQIYPHKAPPPSTAKVFITRADLEESKSLSPLERCTKHQTSKCDVQAGDPDEEKPHSMKIIQLVRPSWNTGAQVLKVSIDDQTYAAKVYDPLYYRHWKEGETIFDIDVDPIRLAERDYTYEAAAYDTGRGLQFIAAYHGSFRLRVNSGDVSRRVHMKLLDFVPGVSMLDLSPKMFTTEFTKEVFRIVIETESRLRARDVQHDDLHPGNILIEFVQSNSAQIHVGELRKVTIIDLADVYMRRFRSRPSEARRPEFAFAEGMVNPTLRWHSTAKRARKFLGPATYHGVLQEIWVDWDWDVWLDEVWRDSTDYPAITPTMVEYWISKPATGRPPAYIDQSLK